MEEGSLGHHSGRKGAISLILTGCTLSPPMAFICLCAYQNMSTVKDCYSHYKKAGNQFRGCCIPEISMLTKEFAVSPCYLDFKCASIGTKQKIDKIDDKNSMKQDDIPGAMIVSIYFFLCICML